MASICIMAYDVLGVPLAGLTPSWLIWLNAETGVAAASEPDITSRGSGEYGVVAPPEDECGILDFGATAVPRYVFIGSSTFDVIAAYDSDGAPLTGLTPTWTTYRSQAGVDVTPQPTFTSLTNGLYRIDGLTAGATGLLDLGVTASPRGLFIGNEFGTGDEELPVVSGLSPADGTSIARDDSISFTVTDNRELSQLLIAIKYAKFRGTTELAWDGTAAVGMHTVEVAVVEGGWTFTITRRKGWPAAPTICVYAVDNSGNEVT